MSKFVNETSRITQKTTITIESESTPVVGNTTLIQEFPKNETHTQKYGVYGKLLVTYCSSINITTFCP